MKKHLLSRIIVISLISLFLFKISLMGSGALVYPQQIVTKNPNLSLTYSPHNPIDINGDTALNQTAQTEGWAGTGTANDPFIIEDYFITGATATDFASIVLKNIHLHVVIQHNLFRSSSLKSNLGVLIRDSSNISLIQNEIENYNQGLFISNSEDIVVTSNLITNNTYGCSLQSNENTHFTSNTIAYSSYESINIYDSLKLKFQSNYILYSHLIYDPFFSQPNTITDSSAPIISNNTFENGSRQSLLMYQTSNAEITWNQFYDQMEGLFLSNSDANNITRNRFSNGDAANIQLSQSNSNIIFMNNFNTQSTTINHITVDTTGNLFYNNNKGNYWSRYTGNDTNNDGIGETPFQIDSTNSDLYPLVDPVDFEKPNITDYQTELTFTSDENVTLNWTAYDDNPTKYDVFQNGTFTMTGEFTNGTTQIEIENMSIGTYLFTITLSDKDDNSASFSTKVTINPVPTTEVQTSTATSTTTVSASTTTSEEEILDFISNNLLLVGGGAIVIVGSLFIILKLLRRK